MKFCGVASSVCREVHSSRITLDVSLFSGPSKGFSVFEMVLKSRSNWNQNKRKVGFIAGGRFLCKHQKLSVSLFTHSVQMSFVTSANSEYSNLGLFWQAKKINAEERTVKISFPELNALLV